MRPMTLTEEEREGEEESHGRGAFPIPHTLYTVYFNLFGVLYSLYVVERDPALYSVSQRGRPLLMKVPSKVPGRLIA